MNQFSQTYFTKHVSRKGFTALEMLISVAIIVLLLGIVAITFRDQGPKNRNTERRNEVNTMTQALTQWSLDAGKYSPSCISDTVRCIGTKSAVALALDAAEINPECDASLVALWHFNEGMGNNASDTSGVATTHTGSFSAGKDPATSWAAGKFGTALSFSGQLTDYVQVSHIDDFLMNEGTISFWFKTSDISQQGDLWSKDANGLLTGGHLTFSLNNSSFAGSPTDGRLSVRIQSRETSYRYLRSNPLTANDWHYVVFSFGPASVHLYVDGVHYAQIVDNNFNALPSYTGGLGSNACDGNPSCSAGTGNFEPLAIGIGTRGSNTGVVTPTNNPFNGLIDEVAFWSKQYVPDSCYDLSPLLIPNYLSIIPEDPKSTNGQADTGYTIYKDAATKEIIIGAPMAENGETIEARRK